jgi:C4-dicarboxylate transporter DctQ subunit
MVKGIRAIASVINRLNWFFELLAEIALVALLLLVFHEVIVRYLLDRPTQFSVEISEYLLVFVSFMCAGWVLREDRHVRMLALVYILPEKTQLLFDMLASVMVTTFCFILTWKGGQTVIMAFTGGYHSSSLLNVPLWIPYSFIPLGALALGLQSIVRIGEKLKTLFGTNVGEK